MLSPKSLLLSNTYNHTVLQRVETMGKVCEQLLTRTNKDYLMVIMVDALYILHTNYSRNNMGQKSKGNCGLWVLNEIIQPNLSGNGLNWLCYLAGNSQTAPTIFFKFSGYVFLIILLRTHKPQLPSHFWPILFLV